MHTLRAITATRPGSRSPVNRRQIRTDVYRTTLRNAALAVALAGAAATAHAGVKASAINPVNLGYSTPEEVFVVLNAAGATTLNFNLNSAGKKILTYSAGCAVNAAAGNTAAFVELDIYVNGVIVAPTNGDAYIAEDPFCSANGVFGLTDGQVRASITVPIQGIKGNNTIQIKAQGNSGAAGFLLGKSALVIHD
jgi:hypothetical protein